MGDIKFRAWDNQNKAWAEMYTNADCMNNLDNDNCDVMQYTGLKDKNGKEIYEGDIIRGQMDKDYLSCINEINLVKWDNKLTGYYPLNCFSTNGVNDNEDTYYDVKNCEIIGNIYENPNLLNKE